VLADLARGVMRAKIADLSRSLEGRFADHHVLMCQLHLDHIAHLNDIGRGPHQRAAESPLPPDGAALRQLPQPGRQKRAIVAIAHTLAVVIWHMMATGTPCTDLGPDFYATRTGSGKETQPLTAKLEVHGHKVTLAPPPDTPRPRTRLGYASPGAPAPSAGASLVLGGTTTPALCRPASTHVDSERNSPWQLLPE